MPRSQAEVKLAHAVMGGGAKGSGMSKEYASEVVGGMHGRRMSELPEHTKAAMASAMGKKNGKGKKGR